MATIYLTEHQVPAHLRAGFSGKRFSAEVCEVVVIPADAGMWSGGSRDSYRVVRLSDGVSLAASNGDAAWRGEQVAREIKLEPGICVVRHCQGLSDIRNLTFFVHPADAAALLPGKVELSELEKLVLSATRSYKALYAGKDRYMMACDDLRYGKRGMAVPTRVQWDETKAGLIVRGYLNRAGAITVTGRNAIGRD